MTACDRTGTLGPMAGSLHTSPPPSSSWPAEHIVVGVTGAPSSAEVIRRAGIIAERCNGDLVGVHVDDGHQPPAARHAVLTSHRELLQSLGGRFEQVVANDVPGALIDFAAGDGATQLVIGSTRRTRIAGLLHGSVIDDMLRRTGIDVHVVATDPTQSRVRAAAPPRLSRSRRRLGWLAALGGTAVLTVVLTSARDAVGQSGRFPLYLLVVVLSALGGLAPAVGASILATFALNWFFTPPLHTWVIHDVENVLALVVFLVVGVLIAFLITSLARWSDDARRGRSEAETLARIASEMVGLDDPLPVMLDRVRSSLQLQGMSLHDEGGDLVAVAGEPPGPDDSERQVGVVVVRWRGRLAPADERVLHAFLAQLTATAERRALRRDAEQLAVVAAADRLRTALLRAVSHDLRTPLASIKASVTSLLQRDVAWTAAEEGEFLQTIDEEVDRLDTVVGNLLDASRLEAGVIEPAVQQVALDEVVASALVSISGLRTHVDVDVPEELPTVRADRGLLERAIANIVVNAANATPAGVPVAITASPSPSEVVLRVIDHGPGVPPLEREAIFRPFQRFGDRNAGTGVGLGLAVARGVVDAMGGAVSVEETDGGGTTMCITLPRGDGG